MEKLKSCSKCKKANEECANEQVRECLKKSKCEFCAGVVFHYPYGKDESRHCRDCGAEWSIWK